MVRTAWNGDQQKTQVAKERGKLLLYTYAIINKTSCHDQLKNNSSIDFLNPSLPTIVVC